MREIGHSAHEHAERDCRTECNLHDVLFAFSDLGVAMSDLIEYAEEPEVPFAQVGQGNIVLSGSREIRCRLERDFVSKEPYTMPDSRAPPLYPLAAAEHLQAEPPYPVRKRHKPATDTFMQAGEVPPPHVPSFLPKFPSAHVYKATPLFEQPKARLRSLFPLGQQRALRPSLLRAALAPPAFVLRLGHQNHFPIARLSLDRLALG